MRTQEEINRQIKGLERMKNSIPEFNFFGDNNWSRIDAQLDLLNGGSYRYYEDEGYLIESAALYAKEWLEGHLDEDLFEDLFEG